MAITESQKESIAKYRAEKRDRLSTDIPKGKRDAYNLAASELGLSLSKLIQCGVEEFIARHAGKEIERPQVVEEKFSAEEKRLVEEFAKLPVDVRKALIKLVGAINGQG